MSIARTEKAKRIIIGRYTDWVKQFDVSEYVQNPPMIEKLYEERQLALTSTFDLEKRVESLESQVNDYKLANQRLELELREASRKSFVMFALSLLATVMVGIGVNIATASPMGWAGWIMIISACLLEGIAYFLRPKKGN
jgi:hypothetical protein